ncbi:Sulfide:quinone oxidoreductase, mitochondrial [Nymphon striatum]|nr:Sulfide:quinone oxidoreductase, mitochondrial [Nymphon striatum]
MLVKIDSLFIPRSSSLFQLKKITSLKHTSSVRFFSRTQLSEQRKSYKLVIVGGGSGGCSTAAKFASHLGKGNVAVIEPAKTHYYQPLWTLVGGGIKDFKVTGRAMKDVLPKDADHIEDKVVEFNPEKCVVFTASGQEISYDYLVVAMGMELRYDMIKGLPDAFETPGVCSNYSSKFVTKTFPAIQQFSKGNAIFTFPNTPIKCAGAPQKIMYLAEEHIRKAGKLKDANIMFNTSLGVIFGVKKYAEKLLDIVKQRNITLNFHHNLIEVNPDRKECTFEKLNGPDPKETVTFPYSLLHITPPMSAPDTLKKSALSDQAGYLDVNKFTLQHNKYHNIFGIGDCTNVPTSKTAAAVAGQLKVLKSNLKAVMNGEKLKKQYDGYTSCPLVVGYNKCILAEFDFDAKPLETFPFDQGKQRRSMYHMKTEALPAVYWNLFLKGYWEGPSTYRKVMSLGMK